MCYDCLSILNNTIKEEAITKLKKYLISLTPNNRDLITVSKIANALNITNEMAVQVILKCEDAGILQRHFGIRCPKCGMLIKELSAPNLEEIYINECYSCDEEISINENDIVILFKLIKVEIPFDLGQQSRQRVNDEASVVAQEDTLKAFRIMCETITLHSKEKHLESYVEKIAKEKERRIHKKAVAIANRNRMINIATNIISIVIALMIIYAVYRKFGYERISVFVTFTAFVIPFGCNFIVKELFLTDVARIKEKLLVEESR